VKRGFPSLVERRPVDAGGLTEFSECALLITAPRSLGTSTLAHRKRDVAWSTLALALIRADPGAGERVDAQVHDPVLPRSIDLGGDREAHRSVGDKAEEPAMDGPVNVGVAGIARHFQLDRATLCIDQLDAEQGTDRSGLHPGLDGLRRIRRALVFSLFLAHRQT
jgi:hypothetical protein